MKIREGWFTLGATLVAAGQAQGSPGGINIRDFITFPNRLVMWYIHFLTGQSC